MTELPDVWAEVAAHEATRDAARSREIGPSDARVLVPGRGCIRQLAYRAKGFEPTDPVPIELVRAAAIGGAIHDRIAAARRESGNWTLIQAPLPIPGFARSGEPDAWSAPRRHLDDVKTVSDRVYAAVTDAGRARLEDRYQLDLYGYALDCQGVPPEILSCTYVRRSDGATYVDSWTYDPVQAEDTHTRMTALVQATRTREPIEFGRAARSSAERPCDSCVFRTRCWGSLTIEREGAAPLPVAGASLQEIARRYHEAAELRADADAVLSELRPILLAFAGATFTDHEGQERVIKVAPGHAHGGRLDTGRARELLERWGEPVPTLGTYDRLSLPVVTERTGR